MRWPAIATAGAAAMVALLHIPLSVFPIGRDQGVWLTAGMALSHGRTFFHDLIHFNLPGSAALYALALAVTHNPRYAPVVLSAAISALVVLGLYLLLAETVSKQAGAWAAIVFAILHPLHLTWWSVAQKDYLAVPWFMLATWAAARAVQGRRLRRASITAAGALVAFAVLCKPIFGITGALISAGLLMRGLLEQDEAGTRPSIGRRIKRCVEDQALLAAGFAIGLAPLFAHLAIGNGLRDAYYCVFGLAPSYYGVLKKTGLWMIERWARQQNPQPSGSFNLSYIALSGAYLGVLAWISWPGARKRWWVAIAALTALGGFFLQLKGARYHLDPWYVIVCMFLGVALARACTGVRPLRWTSIAYALAGLALVWGLVQSVHWSIARPDGYLKEWRVFTGETKRSRYLDKYYHHHSDYPNPGVSEKLAGWLRKRTEPNDLILVWGHECQIYALSRRMYATQAPFNQCLTSLDLRGDAGRWMDEQRRIFIQRLESEQPKYLVVTTHDKSPVARVSSDEALGRVPGLTEYIEGHYALVETIERFRIYERNQPRP